MTTLKPNAVNYMVKLLNHDWYYQYSDSHRVWRAGEESSDDLDRLAKQDEKLQELQNLYAAYKFEGDHGKGLKALILSLKHSMPDNSSFIKLWDHVEADDLTLSARYDLAALNLGPDFEQVIKKLSEFTLDHKGGM